MKKLSKMSKVDEVIAICRDIKAGLDIHQLVSRYGYDSSRFYVYAKNIGIKIKQAKRKKRDWDYIKKQL